MKSWNCVCANLGGETLHQKCGRVIGVLVEPGDRSFGLRLMLLSCRGLDRQIATHILSE